MTKEIYSKEKQEELEAAYSVILERKKNYKIVDFKLQDFQKPFFEAVGEMIVSDDGKSVPKYRALLYQGGNGAGKTILSLYITILLAMGDLTKEYNLPYIGRKKSIFIGTKSSDNLKNVIMPYLMEDFSKIKIPPELIKKVTQDNGVIKTIRLINGTVINFFTYDQGRERIQGTTGDLYLLDEEPIDSRIFDEAIARIRDGSAQMMLSFTPLSGFTPAYSFFYEQESERVKSQMFIDVIDSRSNEYVDLSLYEGLTEQDKKMRLQGLFVPPSGLVYPNFDRTRHTVEFFNPKELGNVRFYAGLDFGVNHPTAFVPVAVDDDENIYIFDLIYERGILMKDLAKRIKEIEMSYQIQFEDIIADAAGKRERTELKYYGISTTPADKRSKGENGDSNRRAGIMKVNQLLFDNKIFIANHLKDAIKEFENHSYKESGKDGAVDKTQDDFLDAFRYFIFLYKPPKYVTKGEIEFNKKYKTKYKKRRRPNTRSPY